MRQALLTIGSIYGLLVLLHSSDMNPLWLWDWYFATVGGWLNAHPLVWLINVIIAIGIIGLTKVFGDRDCAQ